MASRTPIECPLCHNQMEHGEKLEEHLSQAHQKEELVEFVVTETISLEEEDIS